MIKIFNNLSICLDLYFLYCRLQNGWPHQFYIRAGRKKNVIFLCKEYKARSWGKREKSLILAFFLVDLMCQFKLSSAVLPALKLYFKTNSERFMIRNNKKTTVFLITYNFLFKDIFLLSLSISFVRLKSTKYNN